MKVRKLAFSLTKNELLLAEYFPSEAFLMGIALTVWLVFAAFPFSLGAMWG